MEEPAKQSCRHDHHDHECTDHHDCNHHDHHTRKYAAEDATHSGIHVEVHLHEGAVVASGELRILVKGDVPIGEILGHDMTALADWVEKSDGIIGHIKASLETTRTDVFSITDCELSERSSDAAMVLVRIAAIVYGVESDEILAHLEDLLRHLESVGTPVRGDLYTA